MGVFSWFLSWFRRSKPTVVNYEEILTQLQTELREWEEKKAAAISAHRTAVTRLLLWACVLEVIFFVWYYFCTSPTDVTDHLTYIAPVFLTPVLGYMAKRIISWVYNNKICKADEKLIALENQQAEKVEELKRATNFYKTAQLVQQFDKRARTPVPAARKQPGQAGRKPATPGPPASKRASPPQQPATVGPSQRHARPLSLPPSSSLPTKAPPSSSSSPNEPREPTDAAPPDASDLPVPAPGPRPAPPPSQQGRPAPRSTEPAPPQTPSRSYYMPVPDRNNPVALPPSPRGQKPRGWLDTILDVMVGDNEANSVPVRCTSCNSLYGHVPRSEVGSYQFACRKCRFWNDPLNPSGSAAPARIPQQQQQQGRPSNARTAHEAEEEDDMPDLPTAGNGGEQEQRYEEKDDGNSGEPSMLETAGEEEEEEHLLTDTAPIVADDAESEQGNTTRPKSE